MIDENVAAPTAAIIPVMAMATTNSISVIARRRQRLRFQRAASPFGGAHLGADRLERADGDQADDRQRGDRLEQRDAAFSASLHTQARSTRRPSPVASSRSHAR